jgi:hypothetical protein
MYTVCTRDTRVSVRVHVLWCRRVLSACGPPPATRQPIKSACVAVAASLPLRPAAFRTSHSVLSAEWLAPTEERGESTITSAFAVTSASTGGRRRCDSMPSHG